MLSVLVALHAIAAAAWIGGAFFAFMVLRVTAPPEPPVRLALWSRTLTGFFRWVWLCIVTLIVTGYAMTGLGVHQGWPVHAMQGIGWLMFVIFGWLSLRLLPALNRGVAANDFPAAASAMAKMRPLIAVNLVLGLVVIALGASARYLG